MKPLKLLSAMLAGILACGSTAADPPPPISHYGASYSRHADLDLAGLGVVLRAPCLEGTDWLTLDLSAPLEVYHLGNGGGLHFAADYLVALGVMLPPIAVSVLCPSCEPVMKPVAWALLPTWLPLVHPDLVAYPVPGLGIALGYDAAYLFHGGQKGVAFNPRLGLRVEPAGLLRLEGGVNHQNHWNWHGASRSFGWGWFGRLAVSTDLVGGAIPRGGTD